MRILNLIFGFFTAFIVLFLLYLLLFLFSSSKVFAAEDFFLVFISQKDKTAKIISKNPSLRSCQENTEESLSDFLDFLQEKQEKHGMQICCVNKEQTEYVCLYLEKNPLAEGRGFKKDI